MGEWSELWYDLSKLLWSKLRAPRVDGPSVSFSVEVGSGFDMEYDNRKNREKLITLCNGAMNELLPGKDGTTYCNVAVDRVAAGFGCRTFSGMLANSIHDVLESSADWRMDNAERAGEFAENGGLAIVSKKFLKHGHVAIVYPFGSLYWSGSWAKLVPYVANVGKKNGIMPVSLAFPVNEAEPSYFLYRP